MLQNLDPINHFFFAFFSYVSTKFFVSILITDSYPLGRMSRSKFVESFNLAQNGSSVDDPIEVLGPNNGYGTMLVCRNIRGLFSGIFEPCMRRKMPVKLSCSLSLTMEWFFLSCDILPIFYPKKKLYYVGYKKNKTQ